MEFPYVILFAGPVGSSKTPIAYHLSWNLGLPIFNNDAIRKELYENTLSNEWDTEEYYKKRDERFDKLLKSKQNFIYDASIDRSWLDIKKKLENMGYNWFIISLDISFEKIKKLFIAKNYGANEEMILKWYSDHQAFLREFNEEVDLTINDSNFKDRLNVSLGVLKKKIK